MQMRDHPRQQGGLAGAAPSREAYHFHLVLRNRQFFVVMPGLEAEAIQFHGSGESKVDCFVT